MTADPARPDPTPPAAPPSDPGDAVGRSDHPAPADGATSGPGELLATLEERAESDPMPGDRLIARRAATEIRSLCARVDALEEENKGLNDQLLDADGLNAELEEKNDALKHRIEDLEEENGALKDQVEELDEQMDYVRAMDMENNVIPDEEEEDEEDE